MKGLQIRREWQKEIYDRFGGVEIEVRDRFSGFPEGCYTSHSWAGASGDSQTITPFFVVANVLHFGETWDNDVIEYSENGRSNGSNDNRRSVGDLADGNGDAILLGFFVREESLSYDERHDPEERVVLFRSVSTLTDLAREEYEHGLNVFCEALREVFEAPAKEVVLASH